MTRGDGTEGSKEGKGEGGERGEEEGKLSRTGRSEDDIDGSIRGPRGPKKTQGER